MEPGQGQTFRKTCCDCDYPAFDQRGRRLSKYDHSLGLLHNALVIILVLIVMYVISYGVSPITGKAFTKRSAW